MYMQHTIFTAAFYTCKTHADVNLVTEIIDPFPVFNFVY